MAYVNFSFSSEIKKPKEPVNTILLDIANKRQKIDIVGGDMERSQSFLMSAANPEEVARWCFEDINFTVCRVSYDKKQEMEEGVKNMKFYDKAVESMQLIKKVNPNIKFWATMKSDYNGYENSNNLPEWICDYRPTTRFDCDKYALFLTDYLEHMQKNGVPISYMATSKEWTVITPVRAKAVMEKINSECEKRGVNKPLFVDPASWGVNQGAKYIRGCVEAGSVDLYHSFSTHNLNNKEHSLMQYENFVAEATSCGKPAYCDETSAGSGGARSGVETPTMGSIIRVHKERTEFYKDGINGEIVFEIFSRGIKKESRAIYFNKGEEAKRSRSYFVMKTFINSLGVDKYYLPAVDYNVSEGIYSMSFVNDKEIFVTIINDKQEAVENLTINIKGAKAEKIADVVLYEVGAENVELNLEGVKSSAKVKKNCLTYDIPPMSMVFFTIPL